MLLAFHKPWGVLSQFNENPDRPGQRTLKEFRLPPDLQPLGRLDQDSEGLLLLTDEKDLERQYVSAGTPHERTYLAQVEGCPDEDALDRLSNGSLSVQGYRLLPCEVQVLESAPDLPPRDPAVRQDVPTTWLKLILREGRNRQVRRMTAAVGHPTLRLVRRSIGGIQVPQVPGAVMSIPDGDRPLLMLSSG